jgi:hypothetical protein
MSRLRGEPVWIITALTQSIAEDTGSVTIGSSVLVVASSQQAAEDILYEYRPWLDREVIDVQIQKATKVDW